MEISSSGKRMGGTFFADGFVGIRESRETLQKLIDVVYRYHRYIGAVTGEG